MSDITERLRMADCMLDGRKLEDYADALCREAADEIERLRAALQGIANAYPGWASERVELLRERARTALRGQG